MHIELPIGSFIAAVLVLLPLHRHIKARNIAIVSLIVWLFVSNVIAGVNAIIWAGNINIVVPVWCDIATKLQIGANIAIPTCCLCICIHLERIGSVRGVNTHSQRRRRMIYDALACWLLPSIYMALHYVVQGHRFDIIEDFGCRPNTYVSIPAVFLIWVPPMVIVVLTFVFAALALHHFFRQRIDFARFLRNVDSALTTARYFRLMMMAVVQMTWGTLVTAVNIWFACRSGLRPWTGWADVHWGFSRIGLFPVMFIPPSDLIWGYVTWWSVPISAVIFSAFFSFGEEAMQEYAACLKWIRSKIFPRRLQKLFSRMRPTPPAPITMLYLPRPKTSSDEVNDTKNEIKSEIEANNQEYCISISSTYETEIEANNQEYRISVLSTHDSTLACDDSSSPDLSEFVIDIAKLPPYCFLLDDAT